MSGWKACGPVIKAVRFDAATIAADLARWEACEDVEAILIDGPSPGEGVPFRWEDLPPLLAKVDKPVFLAGGLTPENVADAVRKLREAERARDEAKAVMDRYLKELGYGDA